MTRRCCTGKPGKHLPGWILAFLMLGFLQAPSLRAAQQFEGVCAGVKLEIAQELTFERVGFLATLEITNNEIDASITDFSAALTFASPDWGSAAVATDASGLFHIGPPELEGISRVDGSGLIKPGETAVIRWFIIPKIDAGGTTPKGMRYVVGADLGGSIYGERISPRILAVIPDTILVKPEPQLEITYFQPRDVEGDDPFTIDVAESPVPFTLGVLVKNVGYGWADRVRVASEQPRIVENLQNTLIMARLIGSRIGDAPSDPALTLHLGNIAPGQCRTGAWDMITTLSGEFVEFNASYTHASELGGRETSVIKDLKAYFIVREVMDDRPGRDSLRDFLADTVNDGQPVPDTVFSTDCTTEPVNRLTDVAVVSQGPRTATISATADIGNWVYFRLTDPAQAKYPIASVVRSDGKVLNLNNAWTNVRYDRQTNEKLTWLNLFDFVSVGSYEYTVTYASPAPDTLPPVSTLRFSGPVERSGGAWHVTTETQLYFTVEDESPASVLYQIDGDGYRPGQPFFLVLPGTHTVAYYASDDQGNAEASHTATVILSAGYPALTKLLSDTPVLFISGMSLSVRPGEVAVAYEASSEVSLEARAEVFSGAYGSVTLEGIPSSPSPGTNVTITVGGRHVDYYRYRLSQGDWSAETAAGTPLALSGLSPGIVTLSVTGRSRYGSYPPESGAVTAMWEVSPTAVLSITGLTETPTRSTDASLTVNGADRYCYRLDGGFYRPETAAGAPIVLSNLSEGGHVVEVLSRLPAQACPASGAGTALGWTVDRNYGLQFPESLRVRRVALGPVSPGAHEYVWDGRNDAGVVVPPGWYTVRLTLTDGLGRSKAGVLLVAVGDMLAHGSVLSDAGVAGQKDVHASGRWVVWQDQRSGYWNIYARDVLDSAATAFPVSPLANNQERPRTDGRFVVWESRQADGTWDILVKDLETLNPEVAITATPDRNERRPSISWPWVVYQHQPAGNPSAPWQVEAYNLISLVAAPVDATGSDQLDPVIHRQRVVWTDYRDSGPGEIYTRNLSKDGVRRITQNSAGQFHPAVSDDWIVWADTRNTQVDLYGYDLLRNREVRLTSTAEDEAQPFLNGKWVVYTEDSTGEALTNVRMLHLANFETVHLTNAPSYKQRPALASGQVFWLDSGTGVQRVMSGSLPDLQPVFNNRNLVAVTEGMASNMGDAFTLLEHWNTQAGVTELRRYTSLLPLVSEAATWTSGAPSGTNFPLVPGSFVWVRFLGTRILDLGPNTSSPGPLGACEAISLAAGTTILSYSCFPDDYSAYDLIREVGLDQVRSVRSLDSETGVWSVAQVEAGSIVGENFRIPRVAVVMLDMALEKNSWKPGSRP